MTKPKKKYKRKTFGLSVNPSDSQEEVNQKLYKLAKRVWEFYFYNNKKDQNI